MEKEEKLKEINMNLWVAFLSLISQNQELEKIKPAEFTFLIFNSFAEFAYANFTYDGEKKIEELLRFCLEKAIEFQKGEK